MNRNRIKVAIFATAFVLVAAVIAIAVAGKSKDSGNAGSSGELSGLTVAVTPEPTGIYIVDAPPESYSYEGGSGSTVTSDSGAPSGTYVVEAPSDTQTAGDSGGVYVVDTPDSGGAYVVDTPNPGGGGYSPAGITIAGGTFSSNTGTALNIDTSYSAVTATDSTVTVTVSATLRHAALNTGSRPVTFKADGQTASVSAGAINHDGGSTSTYLGSHTFTVSLSAGQTKTIYVGASWAFNGQYSGVNLGSIEGAGNVTLSR